MTAVGALMAGGATTSIDARASAPHVNPPPRYASPHGSGSACTKTQPCKIFKAINGAQPSGLVIVKRGHYGTPTHPLTREITDVGASVITVRGPLSGPPPVIYSAANYAIEFNYSANLSHVIVYSTGTTGGVFVNGSADHVFVVASNENEGACDASPLTDSVCVATGATAPAVGYFLGFNSNITVRNVTAVATGDSSSGLEGDTSASDTMNITVTNSILDGTQYSVQGNVPPTGTVNISVGHCNVQTVGPGAGGGTTNVTNAGGNIVGPPALVKPAKLNFREKPSALTIDHGLPQAAGETDVAGYPRTLGAGTDIGGYEFLPKPAIGTLHVASTTKHSAHLSVKVNPQGLPAIVKVLAVYHGKTIHSKSVSAGQGTTSQPVAVVIHGLASRTTYHVRAVATNDGGHATSGRETLHTH
jgi:hypothetical protein